MQFKKKTISRNAGMLTKLKHFVSEISRIYYILFNVLSYCRIYTTVSYYWEVHVNYYFDKIFKLQNWAIRTISNSHYRSHTGPQVLKHNILNVFDTYILSIDISMYKYHTNQVPSNFSSYFTYLNTHLRLKIRPNKK